MVMKKLETGNAACMFAIQLFENKVPPNTSFFVDINRILLQDHFNTSHAVSQLKFFSKNCSVSSFGCKISVFMAKNGQETIILRKSG